ncbi:hypothetical protein [Pseudoalteromonas luteoviolacea]|uniref:Uncharacterized protein n=1 Tax=Pseudoalteromonas luteoviolacea S4060-1 TaxID=1365257 RepID=A0A167N2M6_9GAMM|nr:hypothetical protein [Pseudoalteromonas luteoviolacea]KZN67363.1 hypothetical protein N478_17520 [Pseudoalteromonas luteoviolacea S4060-1]
MLKRCIALFTFSCLLLLNACSEPPRTLSFDEFFRSIQALNWFAISDAARAQNEGLTKAMPFDEHYLRSRHELLHSVDMARLSEEQRESIKYLKIQERYPERFFAWPPHTDVIKHTYKEVSDESLDEWLKLVLARLKAGRESQVILSRLERTQLLDYLAESRFDSAHKQALEQYLSEYKARSGIGLYQLPNGKEWYQSKLNYYSSQTHDPYELATFLSARVTAVNGSIEFSGSTESRFPAILAITAAYCDAMPGLNWRDSYVDIKRTLANCYERIPLSKWKVLAVVAEVDLGIHLYAWSQDQAMHRLQSRLALNDAQAHALLKNIAFYPATNMAILPYIKALSTI